MLHLLLFIGYLIAAPKPSLYLYDGQVVVSVLQPCYRNHMSIFLILTRSIFVILSTCIVLFLITHDYRFHLSIEKLVFWLSRHSDWGVCTEGSTASRYNLTFLTSWPSWIALGMSMIAPVLVVIDVYVEAWPSKLSLTFRAACVFAHHIISQCTAT